LSASPVTADEDLLDDPLPDERRFCEVCGTSVSFQWRKGPLGKSLCNSCGVKWKLKKYLGSETTSSQELMQIMAEESQGRDQDMHLDPVNDPYYSFKVQVQSLKKELKMATKDSETLASILVSAKLKDREMDQDYRKLVRGSMDKSALFPPPPGLESNYAKPNATLSSHAAHQSSNNSSRGQRVMLMDQSGYSSLDKKDALMELREYMTDFEDLTEEERTVHRFLKAIKTRRW
jgi:hypothetical protein